MCLSGHARVGTYTQVGVHLYAPECMCEYMYVYKSVNDFMSMCGSECMCIHVSAYIHVCSYVYESVCMHACDAIQV